MSIRKMKTEEWAKASDSKWVTKNEHHPLNVYPTMKRQMHKIVCTPKKNSRKHGPRPAKNPTW